MEKVRVHVEGGDHSVLEKLRERVASAARSSGIEVALTQGAATGGMSVRTEPAMTVAGKRVSHPAASTESGIVKVLRLAALGALAKADGPVELPFDQRFRVAGGTAEVDGLALREVVDDATGVRYLAAAGSLCPLLAADGAPLRAC